MIKSTLKEQNKVHKSIGFNTKEVVLFFYEIERQLNFKTEWNLIKFETK